MPIQKKAVAVHNPFYAPVYYFDKTDSTMRLAREYAADGCPGGTFVYAGMQTQGRGRIAGRQWFSTARENLLGTLILRQPPSTDFTLRLGLAVSLTFDSFLPPAVRSAVKWPNDVFIEGKKAAGILCESAEGCLLAGIGMNILQTNFPESIERTATSLAAIIGFKNCPSVEALIPVLLTQIRTCLTDDDWHKKISRRLWKLGKPVRFMRGQNKTDIIEGIITGIDLDGALLITGAAEEHRCYSGELLLS